MKISPIVRILFFIITFTTIYLAPWWLCILLSATGILFFRMYELVFLGVLLDALYPQELFTILHTGYLFTSILLITISISWVLTKEVRFLDN